MRKVFYLFLTLVPFILFGQAQKLSNEAAEGLDNQTTGSRSDAAVIWSLDVENITGDDQCLGCEFDGTHLWISGGGGTSGPGGVDNRLYKIDPFNGTLVNSYLQPTTSFWGMRDLAWDPGCQLIYGGDENGFYSFNPLTETFNTEFTGQSFGTIRALAYDGLNYWTKNFNSPIYVFNTSGNLLNTYFTSDASVAYGAAINRADGCLYFFSQEQAVFYQYDMNGVFTGETYDVSNFPGTVLAGGAFIDHGVLVPGKSTLCGLIQGYPDTVVAIDLPFCGGLVPLSSWSIALAIALILITAIIGIRRFR